MEKRITLFTLLALFAFSALNTFALPKTPAKQVSVDPSAITASTNTTLQSVLEDFDNQQQSLIIPAGCVQMFATQVVPSGWLECDGSAVSRTTYSRLFTAIGSTFGSGDGSTTFNLPDLRGEFVRGWDHDRGVDTDRVFGTAQSDELKSHVHLMNSYLHGQDGTGGNQLTYSSGGTVATQATGGTETRPRNVALMYCIKY